MVMGAFDLWPQAVFPQLWVDSMPQLNLLTWTRSLVDIP